MEFKSLSPATVKSEVPSYYEADCFFYLIVLNAQSVGLIRIKPLGKLMCELSLSIFEVFRHRVLTRAKCYQILDFISSIGFLYVIIGTYLNRLKTLCERGGFEYLFTRDNKHWLRMELAQ